jgi:hypothetical protein
VEDALYDLSNNLSDCFRLGTDELNLADVIQDGLINGGEDGKISLIQSILSVAAGLVRIAEAMESLADTGKEFLESSNAQQVRR